MSQILSQVPRQLLQQQQRLTPQLIQAMDILQLPVLALESRIAQELDSNPALEVAPLEEAAAETTDGLAEDVPEPATADRKTGDDSAAGNFERLDNLVREYDWLEEEGDRRGLRSASRVADDGDSKMDAMANAAAPSETLQEYLQLQWRLLDLTPRIRALGQLVIDHIDDNGRLDLGLEQIALEADPPATLQELEAALSEVQSLDPAGIAARSLQECLLLQLDRLPGEHNLEREIIAHHFEDLQKNRLPSIARSLDVDIDELKTAIHGIGRLCLHPGAMIVERQVPTITPDVIVEYNADDDRYDVRLARGNLRELRISPEFREALERSREDKATREFVKQKIEAASAIIDAIRFRRERLLEVAKAVVEAQRDFLEHGEQHMKVLRMSDLAQRFNCDPSTISRTVDEKYMQTPRGLYPLRRFFTGGTELITGENLGWDSVRAKVQEIIESENKSNPLNDDEIVEKLRGAGLDLARRTVAKYRSQLNIPTARQRRQY